jgi:hypothetical protein
VTLANSTTAGVVVFVVFVALFVVLAVYVIRFSMKLGRNRSARPDRAKPPQTTPGGRGDEG